MSKIRIMRKYPKVNILSKISIQTFMGLILIQSKLILDTNLKMNILIITNLVMNLKILIDGHRTISMTKEKTTLQDTSNTLLIHMKDRDHNPQ